MKDIGKGAREKESDRNKMRKKEKDKGKIYKKSRKDY